MKTVEGSVEVKTDPRLEGLTKACYVDAAGTVRNGHGKPLILPPEGKKRFPYNRPSGIAELITDQMGLIGWYRRMMAIGVYELMAPKPDEDRKALVKEIKRVARLKKGPQQQDIKSLQAKLFELADGDGSSRVGSLIHQGLEDWINGELKDDYTDPIRGSVFLDILDAIGRIEESGLKPVDTEVFLANHDIRYAGTADLVLKRDTESTGTPELLDLLPEPVTFGDMGVIADLKTGQRMDRSGILKAAMQMAVYANSMRYDPINEVSSPLDVSTEVGIILWVPSGGTSSEILLVDLAAAYDLVNEGLRIQEKSKKNLTIKRFGDEDDK